MALVLFEKKGRIAYITLNQPEKRNALTTGMVNELASIWVEFRDDDDLWVAILAGAGGTFCAGGSLEIVAGEAGTVLEKPGSLLTNTLVFPAVPTRYEVWKPVVGALEGYAIGAGFGLAMGTDLRIAAEGTRLGSPEGKRGVPSVYSAFWPGYVPAAIAYEIFLLGDFISAERAYEVGLINRVVPPDQLMESATEMAEKLCEGSPLAVRAMKEVMQRGRHMDTLGALALSEHVFGPAFASEDRREALSAFMEKRKPVWKGK